MELLSIIVSYVLILGGLVTIILPVAPSIPTVWLGIFVYGAAHQYIGVNQNFLMLETLLALGAIALDYTLNRFGLQKFKVDSWSIIGALIGGGIGLFIGPPFEYLVGPVLGAVIFSLARGRDSVYIYQAGRTMVVGFMGGTLIKLVVALVMIGLFILRLRGEF